MTKREELNQWIKNYDVIKEQLQIAFYWKNQQCIDELSERLITTQRQIAELVSELEKQSSANCYVAGTSTGNSNV